MCTQPAEISFEMPSWVSEAASKCVQKVSVEDRMAFVQDAARQNVRLQTGGPFAAAIFEIASGRLVSLGVNVTDAHGMSMLHAEMVAISLAQKGLGSLDLGAPGLPPHELVTSSEPCAMCYGALFWCGVRRLVCGARASDTERAGFDEGAKVENWQDELRQRGIDVVTDIHRDRTVAVLMEYAKACGAVDDVRAAC